MENIILQLIAEIASNIKKAVYNNMVDISENKLALVITMQKMKNVNPLTASLTSLT